jgi:diguanylate cyclase (GGDEF)-like protein/PAS domain S-box-containing protein
VLSHRADSDRGDRLFFHLQGVFLLLMEKDGSLLQSSEACQTFFGYSSEEMGHINFRDFLHEDDQADSMELLANITPESGTISLSNRCRQGNGQYLPLAWNLTCESGSDLVYALVNQGIPTPSHAQSTAQAILDGLTGLPNRTLFLNRLAHALNRSERDPGFSFAVLYCGLDRFRMVNESLGYEQGDRLLQNIGKLLIQCIRPTDMAAHMGGDEFALLLEDIRDASSSLRVVNRVRTHLETPFLLQDKEVFTSISIGIAIHAGGKGHPDSIMRDANIAMTRAKQRGGGAYMVFDQAMHDQAVKRLQVETDLRKALEKKEFRAYYQPVISLTTGRLMGFEALARWHHPEQGVVSPAHFIPVAEETGMIVPIGHFMMREACAQTRYWNETVAADEPLSVSVNLSAKQFLHPSLVEDVRHVLKETNLSPDRLKLEITESAVMEHAQRSMDILHQLKAMKIRLLLDDFGTGYSSLSYLHRLPIDTLKVDRSFVSGMEENETNRQLVQTVITLAHQLNQDLICEGVENDQQEKMLRDMMAEYSQGFLYSKPVTASEAERLIIKDREKARSHSGL